jgi:hypothetical protein
MIAGAAEAATTLEAAGALLSSAMIAGAAEAATILTAAKAVPFAGGGIVGSGTPTRMVNPMVFAGAPRFAAGGLVTGEVPIIAHKGEEVLPITDPRHRFNADSGVRGGAMRPPVITVNLTANGRLMNEEIREHAQTIARHVSDAWTFNRNLRPRY